MVTKNQKRRFSLVARFKQFERMVAVGVDAR